MMRGGCEDQGQKREKLWKITEIKKSSAFGDRALSFYSGRGLTHVTRITYHNGTRSASET